jgi:20S proteasome alpha/beta subunit
MTVLVGVLCQDGVVVGSDSSATFAATPQLSTIEQPVRKTFLVGADVIFATTGAGGLGQRLHYLLAQLRPQIPDWLTLHPVDVAVRICQAMLRNMQSTFLPPGQLGALVAFTCQDGFHLCEFALADFQPEMKTADTWFVSMGSGQLITDPFFGLLRRTLFRDAQPTLTEGILAAYWALHNAIQLNTGGINGPIQLAILHRPAPGGPYTASLLDEVTMAQHDYAIRDIEDNLAAYRQQLTQTPTTPTPGPSP